MVGDPGGRAQNISTRWLRVFVAVPPHDRRVAVDVDPKVMTLAPGETADVAVTVQLRRRTNASVLSGSLTVAPLTGTRVRIPWAVVTRPVAGSLIGSAQLSARAFKPSDVAPAILLVELGQIQTGEAGLSIEPVLRLDIRLRNAHGKDLGLLSRVRDVLPAATRSASRAAARTEECCPPGATRSGCSPSRRSAVRR